MEVWVLQLDKWTPRRVGGVSRLGGGVPGDEEPILGSQPALVVEAGCALHIVPLLGIAAVADAVLVIDTGRRSR